MPLGPHSPGAVRHSDVGFCYPVVSRLPEVGTRSEWYIRCNDFPLSCYEVLECAEVLIAQRWDCGRMCYLVAQ